MPGDTNERGDAFLYDRSAGTTEKITDATQKGGALVRLSGAGDVVAFVTSDGLLVRERLGTIATLIDGTNPALSTDGRFLAFDSSAANLVAGDTNARRDVFVMDWRLGTTERVSTASDGSEVGGLTAGFGSFEPALSADGRFVAFTSEFAGLVAGDTNDAWDVFVKDRLTGETQRVSVATNGSQADNASFSPALSGDGRVVAFESVARNLVANDLNRVNDVFVYDRATGIIELVSIAIDGNAGAGGSSRPVMSADGRFVAFESTATNLVAGDTNRVGDIFVRDRQTNTTVRISVASDGQQSDGFSTRPALSADGSVVAFQSFSTTFVPPGYTSGGFDEIFLHDRNAVGSATPFTPRRSPIAVRCELPAGAASGGSCTAVGFAAVSSQPALVAGEGGLVPVTKVVRRSLRRRSSARLPLRLNRTGRSELRRLGVLPVTVQVTVTDGAGVGTTTDVKTLVGPRRPQAGPSDGPGGGRRELPYSECTNGREVDLSLTG